MVLSFGRLPPRKSGGPGFSLQVLAPEKRRCGLGVYPDEVGATIPGARAPLAIFWNRNNSSLSPLILDTFNMNAKLQTSNLFHSSSCSIYSSSCSIYSGSCSIYSSSCSIYSCSCSIYSGSCSIYSSSCSIHSSSCSIYSGSCSNHSSSCSNHSSSCSVGSFFNKKHFVAHFIHLNIS